jgi:hypothetical protein
MSFGVMGDGRFNLTVAIQAVNTEFACVLPVTKGDALLPDEELVGLIGPAAFLEKLIGRLYRGAKEIRFCIDNPAITISPRNRNIKNASPKEIVGESLGLVSSFKSEGSFCICHPY